MLNPIDYSISKFVSFLDDKTLTEIHNISQLVSFSRGTTIETRGDPVSCFYIIDKGLVKLGLNGIDGSLFNLARLGPGHTFNDTELFLGHNVIYDASAETDVTLYKLSKENIDHLMSNSLIFSKALVSVACTRLETTLSHIGDTLGMPLKARVAKQILSMSESVGSADIVNLRQVDLAHSLGVSRVSIGKALKALASQKFIKIGYGKLEILSRAGLTALKNKSEFQF